MKESFQKLVGEAKSVLVLLPREPYFDQVAAGLALFLSIKEAGKEVAVSCPSEMVVEFNRLVGVNKVTADVGNKNLEVSFSEYRADDIERISSDVEGTSLSLKVIPKPGVLPPKREQVKLSYFGVNADLVILVGGGTERHFPALGSKDVLGVNLAHIGVSEIKLPEQMKIISLARPGSSISEVVAEYVSHTPDIASNLLMGIYEGSKNFGSKYVSAETFKLASELMAAGGKLVSREQLPKRQFPQGAIPAYAPAAAGRPASVTQPSVGKPALEKPEAESTAPKSWMQNPKVYKGTLS